MTTVIGADTDNYDGDISVDRFRRFYGNGGRFNIIGLEAEMPFALPQRDNSEAAGLVVPFGYKFLYWQDDDLDRMKEAAEKFQRPIAPDIEYGNGMPGGVEATVERMAQAKDLLVSLGLFWGWYSSVTEWQRLTGNTQRFAGDRGWTANYPFAKLGGPPVLPPRDYLPDLSTFQSFGGTTLEVLQYADTCYDEPTWDMNAMRMEDSMANLNADGSQKIVSDGNFVVLYNGGVPVRRWGSTDGQYPGRESKLFGNTYLWFRTLDANGQLVAPYWSPDEGD